MPAITSPNPKIEFQCSSSGCGDDPAQNLNKRVLTKTSNLIPAKSEEPPTNADGQTIDSIVDDVFSGKLSGNPVPAGDAEDEFGWGNALLGAASLVGPLIGGVGSGFADALQNYKPALRSYVPYSHISPYHSVNYHTPHYSKPLGSSSFNIINPKFFSKS